MPMTASRVCVIIAARNAARTIPAAIASALREPEVAEVVVVDDASTDDTGHVARAADDGSGRLSVMRLDVNRGPSFARNAAIAGSRSPFLSILDADDFFLEGRFRTLFASADWDFAADNIMLIRDDTATDVSKIVAPSFSADPEFLDFERFIEGNISRRRMQRGELGFLKPVISRAFLDRHGLRYDENLRLGEDYELYARAVACGARFKVIRSCGYGAIVRADSLSGRHKTQDLKRLADADLALLEIDEFAGRLEGCAEKARTACARQIPAAEFPRREGRAGHGIGRRLCLGQPIQPLSHRPGRGRRQAGCAVSSRRIFIETAAGAALALPHGRDQRGCGKVGLTVQPQWPETLKKSSF